jgi:hypothetical protein
LRRSEHNVARVVFRSLKSGRFTGSAPRSVGKKLVVSDRGTKTVRTLDANSASFDEGLRYVFGRNVAKARRENKRVSGVPDVAPRKR